MIIVGAPFILAAVATFVLVRYWPDTRGWHRDLWFWPMIERWRERRTPRS